MTSWNSSLFAPLIALPDAERPRPSLAAWRRRQSLAGPVLGARYRLLQPLGKVGAMTTYDAEDLDNGSSVAIRLFVDTEHGALEGRYLAETRVAISLRHPNIVECLDYGRDILGDGEPVSYLVMEYLEGESLGTTLELDGPLRWTLVLTLAKQICLALSEAHAHGIIHCDISPATCFRVLRDGEPALIKVLDFGAASFACKRTGRCTPDPRLAEPGSAAPELLAGEAFDCRVDIFALGLLMYRLITNRMPYPRIYTAVSEADDNPTLGRTVPVPMRKANPSLEVSAALEAVVLRALALDPEQRHASAGALYDALVAAEQASQRPSRLADDPLRWNPEREAASRPAVVAAANAMPPRLEPEFAASTAGSTVSLRWPPAPSWSTLMTRATLALMLTTLVVRTAWALLP